MCQLQKIKKELLFHNTVGPIYEYIIYYKQHVKARSIICDKYKATMATKLLIGQKSQRVIKTTSSINLQHIVAIDEITAPL